MAYLSEVDTYDELGLEVITGASAAHALTERVERELATRLTFGTLARASLGADGLAERAEGKVFKEQVMVKSTSHTRSNAPTTEKSKTILYTCAVVLWVSAHGLLVGCSGAAKRQPVLVTCIHALGAARQAEHAHRRGSDTASTLNLAGRRTATDTGEMQAWNVLHLPTGRDTYVLSGG